MTDSIRFLPLLLSPILRFLRDERAEFGGADLNDPSLDDDYDLSEGDPPDGDDDDDKDGGGADDGADDKGGDKGDDKDKPVTRRELEELRRENGEIKRSMEYWQRRANGKAEPEVDEYGDPVETDDEPKPKGKPASKEMSPAEVAAFVEDVNERGPAAIDDLLRKNGYMSRADTEALIRNTVRQEGSALIQNQELMRQYPDLNDPATPLFKESARQMEALKGSGIRGAAKVQTAVRLAVGELRARGEWADEKAEDDRLRRVRGQSGPAGRRTRPAGNKKALTKREAFFAEQMGVDPKKALEHKQKHIHDER